tara:strand:- start:108330 stop:108860 length:531 start_codon:yes stop_codon:yes gene_type:complete
MATAAQRAHTSALVGTWVFVLSDAIGFVALLSTMAALRSDSAAFASAEPALEAGLIATALLACISVSLVISSRRCKAVWPWLVFGFVASVGFCGLQYWEYRDMLGPSFVLTSPAQEAFVVVTGYHLLHVAVGGLVLLWALVRKLFGGAAPPMGPISIYWHFVDALWLFIFGFFYLL